MISDFKVLRKKARIGSTGLPTLKVALLGDTATQFLAVALKGIGLERGYNLDLFEADYNQVERQLLDTTSELHDFNAEYIIVFQSTHKLLTTFNKMDPEQQSLLADQRVEFVKNITAVTDRKLIYFNYPEIEDTIFGSYSNKVESSFTYQVRKLNVSLMDISRDNPNLFICDIAALQNKLGRNTLFHPAIYIGSEMVLSIDAISYVASRTVDIIAALQGK